MTSDDHQNDETLGGRISKARDIAKLSASEFANTLGIRKESLIAWENDRSEPHPPRLIKMAGLLNVSPAWLLYGVGEAPVENAASPELRSLRGQLERIKELRDRTDTAIRQMEAAISRIESPN